MPCHNQDKAQARSECAEAERANFERDAIVIDTSPEEELFIQSCAVHCEIDCCGFNALDLSEPQARRAMQEIGESAAQLALTSMRANRVKIGTHAGLIRFRGVYEDAREASKGYKEACEVLNKIIVDGEQVSGGNGGHRR